MTDPTPHMEEDLPMSDLSLSVTAQAIIDLADVPDVKGQNATYQFAPSRAIIELAWEPRTKAFGLDSVTVTGGRRKRNGAPGGQLGVARWTGLANDPHPRDEMPEWLSPIIDHVIDKAAESVATMPGMT